MTNTKATKHALISSVVALFLCFTMLLGTTFAWFTDSVTSAANIIQTGTLDVSLEHVDTVLGADEAGWTDASTGAIFSYDKWEPGYTAVKYVKIENEGTLDLKFILNIIPNADAEEVNLADVIEVYMISGAAPVDRDALTTGSDYFVGNLTSLMNENDGAAHGVLYAKANADAANGKNYNEIYTIALKMSTEAGNDYMGKSVDGGFSIQLLATQLASEEDSMDDQYDVDATYPVANNKQFKDAIADIKEAESGVDSAVISLSTGEYDTNFEIAGGKDVVIQGNGADTVLKGQIATTASNEGTLVLRNLTIDVSEAIQDSTGISQTSKSAIAIWGDQTVICENVTFNMSLADSTAITSWWDTGVGTTIIVRNCTFNCNGQRPIRATGNVTVENCTFNDPYRYAVQLTAKASTATELDKAIINFYNNTIVNGENGKAFVYGIQLEGADYGCNHCVINGSGNRIENGGTDSAMYYCECGKVEHNTIEWNVEVDPVHEQ